VVRGRQPFAGRYEQEEVHAGEQQRAICGDTHDRSDRDLQHRYHGELLQFLHCANLASQPRDYWAGEQREQPRRRLRRYRREHVTPPPDQVRDDRRDQKAVVERFRAAPYAHGGCEGFPEHCGGSDEDQR